MWRTGAQKVSRIGLIAAACLAVGGAMAQSGAKNPYGTCDHKASPEDLEGAKGAHKAAEQFYERGEYERAIQYWNDVYKFDCEATLVLQNIANAYEKLGDRKSAIIALEGYLLRDPNAPDATQIKRKVENLKHLLKPPPAASATAPEPSGSSTAPLPTATSTAAPTTTATAPPPPPPDVKPYGVAPWVTVGVGGAAALAGAILLPVGLGAVSSAQNNCTDAGGGTFNCPAQEDVDKANSGKTQVLVGKIALGVGGAAVAGGLVWELLFNKPAPAAGSEQGSATAPTSKKVRVTPFAGPAAGGLSVHGSF